jgi:uncharacterized protein (DUF934 family)
MQIIKDKHIVDDTWQMVSDEESLPVGDVCVSLTRWQQEKNQLIHRAGHTGVRLQPTDDVMALADEIKHFNLIVLDFPDFADGRGFSQARLLRERLNYQEELRAVGHYMPDQVFYLSRVGVNAFCPEKFADIPVMLAKLHDFSVSYQA